MSEPAPLSPEEHEALLRRRVTLMRELGVVKWNGIELGAAPVAKAEPARDATPEERRASSLAELRDEYRNLTGDYTASVEAIDALIPAAKLEALKS